MLLQFFQFSMRILFLGENWYGSCSRACCYALRRLGHSVLDIDSQTFFPQVRKIHNRLLLRLWQGQLVREYNAAVLDSAGRFQPDALLAFKGNFLQAATLRQIKDRGISLYNYYPDTSAFAHGRWLEESLPEYDCIFSTKQSLEQDLRQRIAVKNVVFLPHGYDPDVHRTVKSSDPAETGYVCDVGVIATHTAYKEQVLSELVSAFPQIDLRIWGNQWARCQSERLKPFIKGKPLLGISYAQAISSFRINLAVMSGKASGATKGDATTTRTYEIPACGGFMLHERSDELAKFFEEGKEVACFESSAEVAEKIHYYLRHEDERKAIAQAGYNRCVPAYSYDNRMSEIVRYHTSHNGLF